MNLNKVRIYFISLILEVPALLIAVLLALIATEKAEDFSKKKNAEIVLKSITDEIQNNYSRVKNIDSITSVMINYNISQIELYKKDNSNPMLFDFVTTEISNVSWEMAKYSELFSEIDPEILKRLGSIHQEQNRVYFIYKNYDLLEINKDPNLSRLDYGIILTNYLDRLSSRYSDLIRRYEDFLHINIDNKDTHESTIEF